MLKPSLHFRISQQIFKLSILHVCFVMISSFLVLLKVTIICVSEEFVLKLHFDVCAQIRPIDQLPHANLYILKGVPFLVPTFTLNIWLSDNGLCDLWQSSFLRYAFLTDLSDLTDLEVNFYSSDLTDPEVNFYPLLLFVLIIWQCIHILANAANIK